MKGDQNRHSRSNSSSSSSDSSGKCEASGAVGGAAALAAATLVTSRYVSFLQSSKATSAQPLPTSTDGVFLDDQRVSCCRKMQVELTCCGKDAADAAVTVGDSEFVAILTAFEAAVAKGTGETTEREEGKRAVATQEGTCAAAEQSVEGCFAEGGFNTSTEADSAPHGRENSNSGSHTQEEDGGERGAVGSVGRAREVLRVLDEDADPQAAVCLGPANAWVVKPAGLSCGRGVEVVSSLRELVAACQRLNWTAVVQKYVERPLLVQVSFCKHSAVVVFVVCQGNPRTQRYLNACVAPGLRDGCVSWGGKC